MIIGHKVIDSSLKLNLNQDSWYTKMKFSISVGLLAFFASTLRAGKAAIAKYIRCCQFFEFFLSFEFIFTQRIHIHPKNRIFFYWTKFGSIVNICSFGCFSQLSVSFLSFSLSYRMIFFSHLLLHRCCRAWSVSWNKY